MTNILDFLHSIIGISGNRYDFIFLIIAGVFALVIVDGIFSFIFGSISSLGRGGRR